MPSKSKSQQRFMGMVRAHQKGELEEPSAAVKKAAKSMKKKDVKDFAKTKHKGLPEKVDETHLYVKESIDSFITEELVDKRDQFFEMLVEALQNEGLTWEEADFAIGEVDDHQLNMWMHEIEYEGKSVEWIAEEIIKLAYQK